MLAAQAIRCGDSLWRCVGGDCWQYGKHEPGSLHAGKARTGLRMGHAQLAGSLLQDGLIEALHES